MGFYFGDLPHDPIPDDDSLETGEVGYQSNVRPTTALELGLEDAEVELAGRRTKVLRARYGHELPVEVGDWDRELGVEQLGWRHAWQRRECHSTDDGIPAGYDLIVAEFPFAGRRRYAKATFRPALRKHKKPFFGDGFEAKVREARAQRRPDLIPHALELLEDPAVVPLDPFNTGHKRIAGFSIPPPMFGEQLGDYMRPASHGEQGRTGWAFGTCRHARRVHDAVKRELFELLDREIRAQGGGDRLRYVEPPKVGTKANRLELTGDVPDKALVYLPHAAWLAMAGPGPGEAIPADRSAGKVALRRLLDLLYNLQRRVNRVKARYGHVHGL